MIKTEEIVKSILEWWKEAQYDTCGDYGEYNVYDENPKFVSLAEQWREENDRSNKEN